MLALGFVGKSNMAEKGPSLTKYVFHIIAEQIRHQWLQIYFPGTLQNILALWFSQIFSASTISQKLNSLLLSHFSVLISSAELSSLEIAPQAQ